MFETLTFREITLDLLLYGLISVKQCIGYRILYRHEILNNYHKN